MSRTETSSDELAILPPCKRHSLVGHGAAEAELRRLIDSGNLSNGWMITGPKGVGKATLAYRVARAFLAPETLIGQTDLTTDPSNTYIRLIDQTAHPDLFVAQRKYDSRKDRYETVISVETVRSLINFLTLTSSSGRRVAIIDTADDMNRNAANALLKVLEEPPSNTLLLLLTSMPGKLLPTIRSRCRKIQLAPLQHEEVTTFISAETDIAPSLADELSMVSGGRPGHALTLALGEGAAALPLVDEFLVAATSGKSITLYADKLSSKNAEELWAAFTMLLLEKINLAARGAASGQIATGALAQFNPISLVGLWENLSGLFSRGTALNTDRAQLIMAAGIAIAKSAQEARAA